MRKNTVRIIPASRLKDLKADIDSFASEQELNGFQKWILSDLYDYTVPEDANASIIIAALPHPAYAKVVFMKDGKSYEMYGVPGPDFDKEVSAITKPIEEAGYRTHPAWKLPMKRLAVQCGLAVYGRNNIAYVEGLGSHVMFAASFSDMPPEDHAWRSAIYAEACSSCDLCVKSCPTGAIFSGRLLIDNSRCLSAMNESSDDFPDWVPATAHHTVYDCLRCQTVCPLNDARKDEPIETIRFTEEETEAIFHGPIPNKNAERLGLSRWGAAVPRNIRLMMDLIDAGHQASVY